MPDIAMCHGRGCASRGTCYRYLAVANPNGQNYGNFEESLSQNCFRACNDYWDITDSDAVNISKESVAESDNELSDALNKVEARIKHLEGVAKESSDLLEEFLRKVDLNEPGKFAWKLALSNLVSKLRGE